MKRKIFLVSGFGLGDGRRVDSLRPCLHGDTFSGMHLSKRSQDGDMKGLVKMESIREELLNRRAR